MDAMKKKTGKYSRGMRQRLGLADVLIKNPEVIILDEPTSGIDPKGVREFLELIVKLSKEEGITVLFSSHNLHQVQQVCDRVGIFVNGKLLAEGDIQSLSKRLFNNSPYMIEAGMSQTSSGKISLSAGKTISAGEMADVLAQIDGVINVKLKDEIFGIDCSSDVTHEIARVIVESGAELNFLNRKEFGLDDIYYRYFEGGKVHE